MSALRPRDPGSGPPPETDATGPGSPLMAASLEMGVYDWPQDMRSAVKAAHAPLGSNSLAGMLRPGVIST